MKTLTKVFMFNIVYRNANVNYSHSTDKNVILSEAYRKIIHNIFGDKKQLLFFLHVSF